MLDLQIAAGKISQCRTEMNADAPSTTISNEATNAMYHDALQRASLVAGPADPNPGTYPAVSDLTESDTDRTVTVAGDQADEDAENADEEGSASTAPNPALALSPAGRTSDAATQTDPFPAGFTGLPYDFSTMPGTPPPALTSSSGSPPTTPPDTPHSEHSTVSVQDSPGERDPGQADGDSGPEVIDLDALEEVRPPTPVHAGGEDGRTVRPRRR